VKKIHLKKKIFLKDMILITGTHSSGKSMISPVVASLNKVEPLRKIYYIDQINNLLYLKKISLETATFLINHILDLSYYEQLIGRNMNFRAEDETSVYNAKDTKKLIKRLKTKRGENVIKKAQKNKKTFLLDTHDGLWFSNVWKNLNIKNLKIIHIHRNPIYVVNSWINSDFGNTDNSLLNQLPSFYFKGKLTPFYALKFKDDYKNMSKTDRIIKMAIICIENEMLNLKKFRKNFISIKFDEFASETDFYLRKICNFLQLKKTISTFKILRREKLPRLIQKEDYYKRKKRIQNLASKKMFEKLLNLEKKYKKFYG
tara:strand:- start:2841 stop:3785 length:945 start_codon:yes stop_codon:yes gene_type:complete